MYLFCNIIYSSCVGIRYVGDNLMVVDNLGITTVATFSG